MTLKNILRSWTTRSILTLTLAVSSNCTSSEPSQSCTPTSGCKEGRMCQNGTCVDNTTKSDTSNSTETKTEPNCKDSPPYGTPITSNCSCKDSPLYGKHLLSSTCAFAYHMREDCQVGYTRKEFQAGYTYEHPNPNAPEYLKFQTYTGLKVDYNFEKEKGKMAYASSEIFDHDLRYPSNVKKEYDLANKILDKYQGYIVYAEKDKTECTQNYENCHPPTIPLEQPYPVYEECLKLKYFEL